VRSACRAYTELRNHYTKRVLYIYKEREGEREGEKAKGREAKKEGKRERECRLNKGRCNKSLGYGRRVEGREREVKN